MNVATKRHMMEDHSSQQKEFDRTDNLTEDFGERSHQNESKADSRLHGTRSFAKREQIKSKEEVKAKYPKVFITMEQIVAKRKRPMYNVQQDLEQARATK